MFNTRLEELHLTELSQSEISDIQGGYSAWYWISYGAHHVVSAVDEAVHDVFGPVGNSPVSPAAGW
jgi:hypothetical protein